MKSLALCFLLCLLILCDLPAQANDTLFSAEYEYDDIENESSQSFFDFLEELFQTGLNINTASREDLLALPGLSISDAEAIIRYRGEAGRFHSTGEIYLVTEVPREVLQNIYPFIRVNQESPVVGLQPYFSARISRSSGTDPIPVYPGNPWKSVIRAKVEGKNFIKAGLVMEKDPYEKSAYDHLAGYITLSPGGSISITAGDFTIQSPGKLAFTDPYPKFLAAGGRNYTGVYKIKPFSGVEENRYFRGLAVQRTSNNFDIGAFYSDKKYDGYFNHIYRQWVFGLAGLHRSPLEIERNDHLSLRSAGIFSVYRMNKLLTVAVSGLYGRISSSGKQEVFRSQSVSAGFKSALLEINSEVNIFNGLTDISSEIIPVLTGFRPKILMRSLQSSPLNVFSEPYRESSKNYGEKGVSILLPFRNPIFKTTASVDFFQFKNKREPEPVLDGLRLFMLNEFTLNPSNQLKLKFAYKSKREPQNTGKSTAFTYGNVYTSVAELKTVLRNQTVIKSSLYFRAHENEYITAQTGTAARIEVNMPVQELIRLRAGSMFYKNDGFNAAIYFTETYLLEPPGIKSFSGSGLYTYLSAMIYITTNFKFAANISSESGSNLSGQQRERSYLSFSLTASGL